MKTIFQAKEVTNLYSVEYDIYETDKAVVYNSKPTLEKKQEVKWVDLYEFNEEVQLQYDMFNNKQYVYISETEKVYVVEKFMRLDIGAYVIRLDKVYVENEDIFKRDAEFDLKHKVKDFNKQMIESNERLLSYCNLHKLNIEDIDLDELIKLVYNKYKYSIKEGKLVVEDDYEKFFRVLKSRNLNLVTVDATSEDIDRFNKDMMKKFK